MTNHPGSTEIIDDLTARRIASEWHNGQGSALYSLASTGAIHAGTGGEIIASMPDDDAEAETELVQLLAYVNRHGERGRQAGWADLSW